jgi:outer membrane biogenesis lipoprotein LolB
MINRAIFLIVSCDLLAACTSELEQAKDAFEKDAAYCAQGQLTQQNVWQQRNCVDEALVNRMRQGGYTHMDWVDQLINNNRAAAAAFYRGTISKEEYNAAVQTNVLHFNTLNTQLESAASAYDQCIAQQSAAAALCGAARSAATDCYSQIMSNAVQQCSR